MIRYLAISTTQPGLRCIRNEVPVDRTQQFWAKWIVMNLILTDMFEPANRCSGQPVPPSNHRKLNLTLFLRSARNLQAHVLPSSHCLDVRLRRCMLC